MKIQNILSKDTLKKLKNYTIMILLLMIGRVVVGSNHLLEDFIFFVVLTLIYEIFVFLVRKFRQRKMEDNSED